ncbi:NmrA family NAD(P)-binding protein [Rhizobium miluonense]|uniref:NmrA-like family protein n=1 Tax=Rhizobium miluonense TaxID=411945 RepID=A0A1C3U3E7_9HYPH|nr:NmrA family NAD(P)-binding protein [Rhizobium miluonense]SCB09974.1 NmrA-like family protein [Rhizobium miluonense]
MFIIDKSQPILVYLAGGVQGGAVVRAALRHGFKVRALVRNPKRVPALAALGIELAESDLRDPASPMPCCSSRSARKRICVSKPRMQSRRPPPTV